MNSSVGVFRVGEIDGQPFFIFTLLSEKDRPSSSSSSSSFLQPLFLCHHLRLKIVGLKPCNYPNDKIPVLFDVPRHFPHQQPENMCKLPLIELSSSDRPYYCNACITNDLGTGYYTCEKCAPIFHKDCAESPFIIKHPSYPFLSLQLYSVLEIKKMKMKCHFCTKPINGITYHCPTNKINMHPLCAMKPIPIIIDHPKRHPHPLTFFPKQAFLPCNACGIINIYIPTYVCLRCVFVVHKVCVYFPNIIRISRHHHHISFTYFLPFGKWSCGVCRKNIDNNYGAYSCNKCDHYFVHSCCALREDLCDGKELEGVPEEHEAVVEPFERISDGIILHFSHVHHLKFKISRDYDEGKFCQACVLPIYEDNYYFCMDQCDFILHEACANLPMKKHSPLHLHPLSLKVAGTSYDTLLEGMFLCGACQRYNCGFVYEHSIDEDEDEVFYLDLQCASISEPFEYQGHEHPLFLDLTIEEEDSTLCQVCEEVSGGKHFRRKLNCNKCNYSICSRCATLPYKARYKHDKHFLTFYERKDEKDHSEWCDVCERKIADSSKKGFYSCDECCTTLHVDCLLGEDMYAKPGHSLQDDDDELHILLNSTMSRPICCYCEYRCLDKVVFKYGNSNYVFCSTKCGMSHIYRGGFGRWASDNTTSESE